MIAGGCRCGAVRYTIMRDDVTADAKFAGAAERGGYAATIELLA